VTLPYCFAKTVVVQYPDVAPTVQPRFRGFHTYQIERCITCDACARACPADCITVNKSGPRKLDKSRDVAVGGAVTQYTIDYNTCLFCGLCVEVCPTECLKMGQIHDNSCYDRQDLVVDFVQLARQGRRTLEPIWLTRVKLPAWVSSLRDILRGQDMERREQMAGASDPEYCRMQAESAAGGTFAAKEVSRVKEKTA